MSAVDGYYLAADSIGDFQPEELYGQLKAEQINKDYIAACQFIESTLGHRLSTATMHSKLQDGIVLCKVLNKLRPGVVTSINYKNTPFAKMENIAHFLAAAQKLGLQSTDLFQTVDLYEAKNMNKVVSTILTIARVVAGIPFSARRKDSDEIDSTLGETNRDNTQTVQNYASHRSFIQATLVEFGNMPGNTINGSSVPRLNSSKNAVDNSYKHQKDGYNATIGGQDLATIAICTKPCTSSSQASSMSTKRTINVAERISKRQLPTEPATPNTLKSESDGSSYKSSAIDPFFNEPRSPPIPTFRMAAADIFKRGSDASDTSDDDEEEEENGKAPSPKEPEEALEPPLEMPQNPKTKDSKAQVNKDNTIKYTDYSGQTHSYQLGNCIGKGQFGAVYRALNLESGQMVAVKQIPVQGQESEQMEAMMNEVELLKSLSNPRIVRYHGFVKTSTHLNLIMEYVENGSLNATLKSFGEFPEKLVLAYVVKIIEGLIYLHSQQVVHCDLKAANILTTKKGNTKLTDFGVSLNLKISRPSDDSIVAGTPNWMAPEIIQLEGACKASDIWSLGCTIVELLTGKPPYYGMVQMAALYHIVEDEHPPLPPSISDDLRDFLLQCFQKDPKSRPSASHLLKHPWISQYRRNHKEMRLLRRNHSMKMSKYMGTGPNRLTQPSPYATPPFSSSLLDALPLFASKPMDSISSRKKDAQKSASDQKEAQEGSHTEQKSPTDGLSSESPTKDSTNPEQVSKDLFVSTTRTTKLNTGTVSAKSEHHGPSMLNKLNRRLKVKPRKNGEGNGDQSPITPKQKMLEKALSNELPNRVEIQKRERSSSVPQDPNIGNRVLKGVPLNPSRPNLTLETRKNNAKEAFAQCKISSPSRRIPLPKRASTQNVLNSPQPLASSLPSPSPSTAPPLVNPPISLHTKPIYRDGSYRSFNSSNAVNLKSEDGWEIIEPDWNNKDSGYQTPTSQHSSYRNVASGSHIPWFVNTSQQNLPQPQKSSPTRQLRTQPSATDILKPSNPIPKKIAKSQTSNQFGSSDYRSPLTPGVFPLGSPGRPTSLPNGFAANMRNNPYMHSTDNVLFMNHPNYSVESDLSMPTLANRVRTISMKAVDDNSKPVYRTTSNGSSEGSTQHGCCSTSYVKPPVYPSGKKPLKKLTRDCSIM